MGTKDLSYTLPGGKTIGLLSEMRTVNYDFGDFEETAEELADAYREATDKETRASIESRIEAQCDAFADFLGIQHEEIQGTVAFNDLSREIKQTLLNGRI